MFDMGPYYLTALVTLLGPVRRVTGSAQVSFEERLITSQPHLEIYGTEGSLSLPDPNTFGGPVLLQKAGKKKWTEIPVTRPYTENSRGLGVADMAQALRSGEQHQANAEIACHVLEIMEGFQTASLKGQHLELSSSCARPHPLPGTKVG